jgi:putative tricarboxylic transport membrane protein
MDNIVAGLALLFQVDVLLPMLLASVFGLAVGAIPGLTASMAVSMLVPLTFFMSPLVAISTIVAVSAMAITSGDIPAALIRIPGTPASAAYVEDSYALTLKGQAGLVLGTSLVTSAIGGIFGTLCLIVFAPALAEFALNFSAFEFFWLCLFGLSCALLVSNSSVLKGVLAILIGLLLALVGLDPVAGQARFTFGSVEMIGGLGLVPLLVGMFAVPELIRYAIKPVPRLIEHVAGTTGSVFRGLFRALWPYKGGIMQGNVIGTLIGALPGAGSDVAAYVSYAISKKFSKTPELFGTGHLEGVAAAGAANNSAVGGAWIPAMVFGIPGDSLSAIVIGVLLMKGITPGPTIFTKQPQLTTAILESFILANVMLIPLGWAAIKFSTRLLTLHRGVLMPLILVFCMIGAFAITNSVFAIVVMLGAGLLGYLMEENDIPTSPAILAFVLCPMIEANFLNGMLIARGDFSQFFARPLAATLGALVIAAWVWPLVGAAWTKLKAQ